MKKIWIVFGLISSSLGNFSLSALALFFAPSAARFGEFAIAFTFYTILISFYRPLVCDALINRDLYPDSNNREFLFDSMLVSIIFSLFSFLLYISIPWLHSSALLTIIFSLPALLMHDALRFKFLSVNSNKDSATLDIVWTSGFAFLTLLFYFLGRNSTINLLITWVVPTFFTTAYGCIKLLKFDAKAWKKSWLFSTRQIWIPNFKDFIYGQGAIQSILLFAIIFMNPGSISSFRIAVSMLFPLTLIQSAHVLSFFNYGDLNYRETLRHVDSSKTLRIRKRIFRFSLAYSFMIVVFSQYLLNFLTKFDNVLDQTVVGLCSIMILINFSQINIIQRIRKKNKYHELVRIRKHFLPILIFQAVVFTFFMDFHGLLSAIIVYQIIVTIKFSRVCNDDSSSRPIGIICEFNSGGAFLAALNQFETYLRSARDSLFYSPVTVDKIALMLPTSKQVGENVIYLKFPSTIFDLSQVLPFLVNFRKAWIRTGRPLLFAHGIRSGFLISICTLTRPVILLHRNIDIGLPLATRSLLKVRQIFCRKLLSVSPVPEAQSSVEFYPILSPLLINHMNVSRSSRRLQTTPIRILWIARLEFPKLPEMLLSALQYIPKSDYTCRMVGIGPKRLQCQEMALRLNLNIEFIEHSSTMLELKQADLVVLLSEFEGIPFILQEALAANVPVIATRLPGNEFLGGEAFIYANNEKEVLEGILKCLNPNFYEDIFELIRNRWTEIRSVFQSEWKLPDTQYKRED